ncbi:MAG: glycosyltransferase [Lachnospiraceae bacterium]|nr:glycosyltransferase [Lachnospiraceae bacterium]
MHQHTFVICAYKKSPYLEACIQSLKKQTVPSEIIMVTSTPNEHISEMSVKYGIPLYISEGGGSITRDWNFGYAKADAAYVTITHQDDIYLEHYAENVLQHMNSSKRPLIYFSDYYELRGSKVEKSNTLLRVKRLMLLPLRIKGLQNSRFVRRRILSFGSPICCPSVAYAKENLPGVVFREGFWSCEDWEAWEMISRRKGSFLYESRPMMYHRIHEDSATTSIIEGNARSREEYQMYCKFWPKWFAQIITKTYAEGQKSNSLDR